MMYDNTEKLPRAILVAVDTGEYDAETSLLELEELARTAGGGGGCHLHSEASCPRFRHRGGLGTAPGTYRGSGTAGGGHAHL